MELQISDDINFTKVKDSSTPLSAGTLSPSRRDISIDTDSLWDVDLRPKTKDFIESIYGSAMATTVGGMSRGMILLIHAYLIANIFFQGYLLYAMHNYICAPSIDKIRHIYQDFQSRTRGDDDVFSLALWNDWDEDEKATLCQVPLSQPILFMVLLSIWSSCVLIDFRETVTYSMIWYSLPRPEDVGCSRPVSVKRDQDGGHVLEAASTRVKVQVFTLVLIPKAAIALVLWWLGARWLTATPSFENLVLNAVALAFITDLDEIIYRALAADEVKAATTSTCMRIPIEEKGAMEPRLTFQGCRAMVGWTLLNVLLPILYLLYFQTVIPNYDWDLLRPCTGWIASLNHE